MQRVDMKVDLFLKLSLLEKTKALYCVGTFITDIRYYKYKINLYLYLNNYFEVFIDHKKATIEKIEPLAFRSKRIKFYTDQLEIQRHYIKAK